MTPENIERYARHLVLKEVGGPGQRALGQAKVAIVGAGGLGGPAALYLAAAGIGHITLIDDDTVDLSNLQRQIQFTESDIGREKTRATADCIGEINSGVVTEIKTARVGADNASALLGGHTLILDGTDSFETRFIVNDAALTHKIPLVSGAIGRFDGQVSVFSPSGGGPCYKCLVPNAPPNAETCSEVGVIGALAGIIGSMMALEAIKYITGAGQNLTGRLWVFDGLHGESRTVNLARDPDCPACANL